MISRFMAIKSGLASKNPQIALQSAFELLNIEVGQYLKIRSIEQKKQLLLYRFLNAEFKYSAPKYQEFSAQLLPLIDQAYQLILTAACTVECDDPDNQFSYGLTGLSYRSIHQQGASSSASKQLDESVFTVGKKDAGVTPGFKAFLKEDLFQAIYQAYPDKNDRLKLYREHHYDPEKFYQQFETVLPERMIKLAYKNLDSGYRVVVDAEDVKRSGTVQKYFSKGKIFGMAAVKVFQIHNAKRYDEINCEAALEAVANDIASLFMPTQKQTLFQGRYANGLMQLMLMQVLNKRATILGPLAGDKTNNQSYCVKPVLYPVNDEIKYLSDDSIPHLAEHLAIMLIQGDYDGIGSAGQNKMRDGNAMYAIDFGHAYQASIIKLLDRYFHFIHPEFKNYSIFYDSPRSDIVRGLIKVAALAKVKVDDNILLSYGKEFKAEIDKLYAQAHSDIDIFNDYIRRFEELKQELVNSDDPIEIRRENVKGCEKIITALAAARDNHKSNRDNLIKKFRSYLSLEASAIDLQENIEKICTPAENISLRSPDGEVLLNHLRINDPKRAEWTMLTAANNQEYVLTGTFSSATEAEKAMTKIKEMAKPTSFTLQQKDKTLTLTFNKEHLSELSELFHEDKIKEKYCSEDYKLYRHYKAHAALKQQLEDLSQYGAIASFTPDTKNTFSLTLKANEQKGFDPLFAYFFKKHLCQLAGTFAHEENEFRVYLPDYEVTNLHQLFNQLPKDIATLQSNYDQLAALTHTFNPFGTQVNLALEAGDECSVTFTPLPPHGFDPFFNYFFRQSLAEIKADYKDNGQVVSVKWEFSKLNAFYQKLACIPNAIAKAKEDLEKFNIMNENLAKQGKLGNHIAFLLTAQPNGYTLEIVPLTLEPEAKRYLQMTQVFLGKKFNAEAKNNTKLSVSFEKLDTLTQTLTEFQSITSRLAISSTQALRSAQTLAPTQAFHTVSDNSERKDSEPKAAVANRK